MVWRVATASMSTPDTKRIEPEDSSTVRGATNATATPLISAPWSLLTATMYASTEASMMFVDSP